MRKVICMLVTVVSLALFSGQAYAQRCLPGMKGVELRGGFAEGSKSPLNHYAGFAVSGYTKKANRWVIGAEYLLKNYEYRNISVPRAQFTAEGGYYLKFLSDPSKTLFLSIGGSALAGYETVNWGDRVLYDGSRLLAKDAFVYGGAITLELETYITDRIVLLAGIRERALWGGSLSVLTTQFGLGVKLSSIKTLRLMNIEEIRRIPITDFLARMGHEPTSRKGNEWWYSAPYREERTPSFRVNIQKNVWQDFGIGRGGDIFSLAGEFTGSSDFKKQAGFISEVFGGIVPETVFHPKEKRTEVTPDEENCFVKVRFGPLYNKVLLNYLKERGICSDVALFNCEEVRYTLRGKRYFAIGFKNVSGGYEVRNRLFKGSISPKDISLIDNSSDICNLFEGFIDYLSWMMLGLGCGDDYLVLNSVSLLERSFGILDRYERVNCYLDRDEAGRRALEALRKRYGNKIEDCSALYKGFKDLNEYLQHKDGILE